MNKWKQIFRIRILKDSIDFRKFAAMILYIFLMTMSASWGIMSQSHQHHHGNCRRNVYSIFEKHFLYFVHCFILRISNIIFI